MAIYNERIDLGAKPYQKNWELKPGDIYSVAGKLAIQGGVLMSNGYRLYSSENAENAEAVIVQGNTNTSSGGAFYLKQTNDGKQHEIKNTVFAENKGSDGAAVYLSNGASALFEDCVFDNNVATKSGALYVDVAASTVSVKNTQFLNNISLGETGQRFYDAGGIYLVSGKLFVEDCVFYGNIGAEYSDAKPENKGRYSGAIAIYSSANLIFRGENILGTESDTIFSNGNITFDISKNTTSESASRAVLNNFDNINNIKSTEFVANIKFNIDENQRNDVYLIAGNATKIGTSGYQSLQVTIGLGATATTDVTINASTMTKVGNTDIKVALKTTENNDLLLVVGDSFVFVDNEYKSWDEEPTRTATYRGAVFEGTQETDRHFDRYSKGVAKVQALNAAAEKNIGKLIGVDTGVVSYSVPLKGVTAELTGGTFTKQVFGGTIFTSESLTTETGSDLTITDGKYENVVIAGDFVQGGKVEQSKACNLFIGKGDFKKAVAAGGFVSNTTSGSKLTVADDVSLTIAGGIFNERVYGGIYATNDDVKASNSNISGDIDVLVKVGQEKIAFKDGLVAGSRGTGVIDGNVKVTFTGIVENSDTNDSNLVFGGEAGEAKVWGGSNMDKIIINGQGEYTTKSSVTGDSLLVFKNFKDNAFEAKVGMFKSIEASGSSQVTFTCAELDTTIVENWTLGAGCSLAGLVKNDFTGDTLNLNYNGDASHVVLSGGDDSLKGWNAASTVTLNGVEAAWQTDDGAVDGGYWKAALTDSTGIKLYRNENNGLMLASY